MGTFLLSSGCSALYWGSPRVKNSKKDRGAGVGTGLPVTADIELT